MIEEILSHVLKFKSDQNNVGHSLLIYAHSYWYHNQPTSLCDTCQQIGVIACKNRPKVLYKQAKDALDS